MAGESPTAAEPQVWLDGAGTVGGCASSTTPEPFENRRRMRATRWMRLGRAAAVRRSSDDDARSLSDSMVYEVREAYGFFVGLGFRCCAVFPGIGPVAVESRSDEPKSFTSIYSYFVYVRGSHSERRGNEIL
jgi:hypothetical protein